MAVYRGRSTSTLERRARHSGYFTMEFYPARRGRLIATLVAVLFGALIAMARILVGAGFRHHSWVAVLAIPCVTAAIGLFYLKPWARQLTLLWLGLTLAWISSNLYWLTEPQSFPVWYVPLPTFGSSATALEVLGGLGGALFVLLFRSGRAFRAPTDFVSNRDAAL
jgi:hypothetical protein